MGFTECRYIDTQPTFGVDFYSKILKVDGIRFKMQLWDTAGKERFYSLTRTYFRNAIGALVVFDLSNRKSFEQMPDWIYAVEQHAAKPHLPVFVLVGNKSDLEERRQVQRGEVELFAKRFNMKYLETSAKTGQNVEEVYTTIARRVYDAIQSGTIQFGTDMDGIVKGEELANEKFAKKKRKSC